MNSWDKYVHLIQALYNFKVCDKSLNTVKEFDQN